MPSVYIHSNIYLTISRKIVHIIVIRRNATLTGELDEDDDPTDVQAEIIELHPDGAVKDIGLWPDHLSQELVDYLNLHNRKLDTPSMFERQNRNGEVVKRSCLCFSPADVRV